tara:strand:- start:8158 stop:8949 length:792 start_codon:yes stop_codon:yes gene_type:complete
VKIHRIETNSGDVRWASSENSKDFYLLNGSLEGFTETTEVVAAKKILPPVIPPAVYIIGYNYATNVEQARVEAGSYPVVVMKATSTIIATGDSIDLPNPSTSEQIDYEGELAIVIGKRAKDVPADSVSEYILGYTIANDVTARDWQQGGAGNQWVRSKNFDTFCPLGPAIVTTDSLNFDDGLMIRTWLNKELRQEDTTASMIFTIEELVVHLSASNTLLPGTVILTGTPAGTGKQQDPPAYLKTGDSITIEIDGLGVLENIVS